MRTPIAAALALVLAFGCTDQGTSPTALNDGAVAPTFDINNAPPASGVVLRGTTDFAVSWVDFKNGTQVIIGADIVEFCNGTIDFDVATYMDVYVNDRPFLSHLFGDDLRTSVWGFTDFDCDKFTTLEPLAVGLSDLVNTDNDFFGSGPDDNNANAWGFRAHGTLVRPSGDKAQFSGHLNLKGGFDKPFHVTAKISLH